jgi:16S rRNA G966 N2-methylase RsmD
MSRLAPLWSVEHAEALAFLRSRPTASAGLVFFSPPYADARTYGAIKFKLRGEAWVKWMRPIVVEAARVSKGLVIVNAAGKVRKHLPDHGVPHRRPGPRLDGLVMGGRQRSSSRAW